MPRCLILVTTFSIRGDPCHGSNLLFTPEVHGSAGRSRGSVAGAPCLVLGRADTPARVAVGTCREYGAPMVDALAKMFDQLGGMQKLVAGKTVAIKLNLTGSGSDRLGYVPIGLTQWVHPDVITATVHLLGQAGARRIRLLESAQRTAEPLDEFMLRANWEPRHFTSAAPRVEFENTNFLGSGKKYSRFWVPGGGVMFKGYDLNHSYEDCDVFVSLAKTEGARLGRHYPFHEELFWHHALHDLRRQFTGE